MAENFIVNGSDAVLNAQGETNNPAARTAGESLGAPSDAELRAIADINGFAVMQTGPTAAEKLQVAQTLLISAGVMPSDFTAGSSANTRQKIKIRKGVHEMQTLWDAVVGA